MADGEMFEFCNHCRMNPSIPSIPCAQTSTMANWRVTIPSMTSEVFFGFFFLQVLLIVCVVIKLIICRATFGMDDDAFMKATNANLLGSAYVVRALNKEKSELEEQLTKTMHELTVLQLKYERLVCALRNGWPISLNAEGDIIIGE